MFQLKIHRVASEGYTHLVTVGLGDQPDVWPLRGSASSRGESLGFAVARALRDSSEMCSSQHSTHS